jgi:hypothetical protein
MARSDGKVGSSARLVDMWLEARRKSSTVLGEGMAGTGTVKAG